MSIFRDIIRFIRGTITREPARSFRPEAYERLLANSVSPKPAQKLVKEALGDAVALRHATSKEDFDEAAAKIRVRELARRITFDFKNRMMR